MPIKVNSINTLVVSNDDSVYKMGIFRIIQVLEQTIEDKKSTQKEKF